MILEVGKSKIKSPADLVSGKGALPALQTVSSWLCPHMGQSSEDVSLCVSSYKGTNLITKAPLSRPDHLPKAPTPKTITVELGFQHMDLGWGT